MTGASDKRQLGVDEEDYRFNISEQYLVEDFWETESDSQREVGWVYSNVIIATGAAGQQDLHAGL